MTVDSLMIVCDLMIAYSIIQGNQYHSRKGNLKLIINQCNLIKKTNVIQQKKPI